MASVRVNKCPNFTVHKIVTLLEPIGLSLSRYTLLHCGAGRRVTTSALIIERNEGMDNEMIERVAKAILETPNASDYETLVARNAIKAMREPTVSMAIVGCMELPDYDPDIDAAKNCWNAMIDAVINDK